MWNKLNIFVYSTIIVVGTSERSVIREKDADYDEGPVTRKSFHSPTLTPHHSGAADSVVDKFATVLLDSERYLKMIESVERKLTHLDASLHDRTTTILKYLSELLRTIRNPAEESSGMVRVINGDAENMKPPVTAKEPPSDGEYHMDSGLDNRLSALDIGLKNIQSSVDSIVSTIAEVKNRQYARTFTKSESSGGPDTLGVINEFKKALLTPKAKKCDCKSARVERSERYPTDCHEIQVQGFNVSGIYKIRPDDMEPFYVLCDLTTAGGGWTVFQNRFEGSQDFYKSWYDYMYGFGNLAGEFWLGLEKLNYLTNQKLYELRIELETDHGQDAFASYSVFTVGPEHEGFRISTLGTYYGTAGDSLAYHAGQKFSTYDVDNDEWKEGACAVEHGGAWWYKECDKSNLNGRYVTSTEETRGQGIYWISFKGPNVPLTKSKMMIRPLPASKPLDVSDVSKRKFLESPNVRPQLEQGISRTRVKSGKGGTLTHRPYKYDGPPQADIFFPNYA